MDNLISSQDAIDILKRNYPSSCFEDLCKAVDIAIKALSEQSERKAPTSYKEQLSLDCDFCRQYECGDTLYGHSDWDGGISFDYIRDIRFCPICGRKLYGEVEDGSTNE